MSCYHPNLSNESLQKTSVTNNSSLSFNAGNTSSSQVFIFTNPLTLFYTNQKLSLPYRKVTFLVQRLRMTHHTKQKVVCQSQP